MKIIFDIGANNGQNFDYFLEKVDVVIAIEANTNLVSDIKSKFKHYIDQGRLIIENIALNDNENIKETYFYLPKSRGNDYTGSLFPDSPENFIKQKIKCQTASSLIKKYLKIYKISEIEYVKIDAEGSDKLILNDLFKNNVIANNLSVECHDPEIIELLLKSDYKSFKFVKGGNTYFTKNVEISTKFKKKIINFDKHSSGPYGDDIPGDYYDKKSILTYFLNNGLGWKDVHASLDEKNNLQNIKYLYGTHQKGFIHHLRNLLPSFTESLKKKYTIFKRGLKKF